MSKPIYMSAEEMKIFRSWADDEDAVYKTERKQRGEERSMVRKVVKSQREREKEREREGGGRERERERERKKGGGGGRGRERERERERERARAVPMPLSVSSTINSGLQGVTFLFLEVPCDWHDKQCSLSCGFFFQILCLATQHFQFPKWNALIQLMLFHQIKVMNHGATIASVQRR